MGFALTSRERGVLDHDQTPPFELESADLRDGILNLTRPVCAS